MTVIIFRHYICAIKLLLFTEKTNIMKTKNYKILILLVVYFLFLDFNPLSGQQGVSVKVLMEYAPFAGNIVTDFSYDDTRTFTDRSMAHIELEKQINKYEIYFIFVQLLATTYWFWCISLSRFVSFLYFSWSNIDWEREHIKHINISIFISVNSTHTHSIVFVVPFLPNIIIVGLRFFLPRTWAWFFSVLRIVFYCQF